MVNDFQALSTTLVTETLGQIIGNYGLLFKKTQRHERACELYWHAYELCDKTLIVKSFNAGTGENDLNLIRNFCKLLLLEVCFWLRPAAARPRRDAPLLTLTPTLVFGTLQFNSDGFIGVTRNIKMKKASNGRYDILGVLRVLPHTVEGSTSRGTTPDEPDLSGMRWRWANATRLVQQVSKDGGLGPAAASKAALRKLDDR